MRYIQIDRTRHNDWEKCPRLRFITHEYPTGEGTNGITRGAFAVPLLSGATIHKGLEAFCLGNQANEAVQIALDEYDRTVAERGIELEMESDSPESVWVPKVQRLLCEALIRGWIRCVWPKLNDEFEIIDVEKEEILDTPVDEETIIRLMTRSDLILRRKADGRHFVMNHKSINEPSDKKLQALRYDTQSISEVLAAQARYDADVDWARVSRDSQDYDPNYKPVQIDGVIYDLLIKGAKKVEHPKGSGVWHNNSPLIWCYVKEGQTGISPDEIAAKFEYTCTAPHQMYRKQCPGNAFHRLGPQWHRKLITDVFTTSPILEWFMWLERNEPDLLRMQFNTLPAIMRSPYDVEVWKRSVLTEEWGIADRAEMARKAIIEKGFIDAQPDLDVLFPRHTAHGNCFWPGKCPMFDVCWGALVDNVLEIENNEGKPMYVPRKSNHPEGQVEAE